MKTPRELILERHRAAEAKLESMIQADELGALAHNEDAPAVRPYLEQSWWRRFWEEAIVPWQKVWTRMAIAWVILLFVQLIAGGKSPATTMAQLSMNNPTVAALLREQRELLSSLLN